MRRFGAILGVTFFAVLLGASVGAAGPTITVTAARPGASGAATTPTPVTDTQGNAQPPVALLGAPIIASGQGFPASQPVQAFLVVQSQAFPLVASVAAPMTDGAGAFQNLTFTLPAPGSITSGTAQILISAGSATASAPVTVDSGIPTGAGRGDTIAVSIGAAFAVFTLIVVFLLTRGLPIYPTNLTRAVGSRKS